MNADLLITAAGGVMYCCSLTGIALTVILLGSHVIGVRCAMPRLPTAVARYR